LDSPLFLATVCTNIPLYQQEQVNYSATVDMSCSCFL